MRQLFFYIISFFILSACKLPVSQSGTDTEAFLLHNPQATSLLGAPLNSPPPSEALSQRWKEKATIYATDSSDVDNIIWYGRFTAYMGNYKKAINIYSRGIQLYPKDARLYRHRGHRYITTRQLEKAITDFTTAATLIEGLENEIEPDGMPNALNIPVSTLHGNIYYHLGLAHYLRGNMAEALTAYRSCMATSERPDNVVSAAHWLYMILRKLEKSHEAEAVLSLVNKDMDIIENHSYHNLCLFYKGVLPEQELLHPDESTSANDAVKYGLANWYTYHDTSNAEMVAKGIALKKKMLGGDSWASFGYIAAEADLSRSSL